MPAGKIDEIEEGSDVYKIRTDFEEYTLYEIQNRSKKRIEAIFNFHVVENIKFELCPPHGRLGAVSGSDNTCACYTASVAPGDTVKVVKLMTAESGKPWKFDYKLTAEPQEEPAWLDE